MEELTSTELQNVNDLIGDVSDECHYSRASIAEMIRHSRTLRTLVKGYTRPVPPAAAAAPAPVPSAPSAAVPAPTPAPTPAVKPAA